MLRVLKQLLADFFQAVAEWLGVRHPETAEFRPGAGRPGRKRQPNPIPFENQSCLLEQTRLPDPFGPTRSACSPRLMQANGALMPRSPIHLDPSDAVTEILIRLSMSAS